MISRGAHKCPHRTRSAAADTTAARIRHYCALMPSRRTPAEPYPTVRQFLGAYLHQDWDIDYPTAAAAVAAAIRDFSSVGDLPAVERELAEIDRTDDATVETILGRVCDYHPAGDGLSYREWLSQVLSSVRTEL